MAKKSEYLPVVSGEWVAIPLKNYREQCCDCGLVHLVNFRIKRNGRGYVLEAQAFRDHHATGGARGGKK